VAPVPLEKALFPFIILVCCPSYSLSFFPLASLFYHADLTSFFPPPPPFFQTFGWPCNIFPRIVPPPAFFMSMVSSFVTRVRVDFYPIFPLFLYLLSPPPPKFFCRVPYCLPPWRASFFFWFPPFFSPFRTLPKTLTPLFGMLF